MRVQTLGLRRVFAGGVLMATTVVASAADPEIARDKAVEPRVATTVDPALESIGAALSLSVAGPGLHVGGAKGIGVVDATGKVLWTLKLPVSAARQVTADDSKVGFTSFDVGSADRSSILASELLGGELAAKPEYLNATVGLADAQGKLLWSVPSNEQDQLSPPALSSQTVGGVVGAKNLVLCDKASVKLVAGPISVLNGFAFTDALIKQWVSRAPVVSDEVFHIARSNVYMGVSAEARNSRPIGAA